MTELNNKTGSLYYSNKSQDLWIRKISQENSLDGQTHQSKLTRHFYPRYYSPGNLHIECIAPSQKNYQEVARFIRDHHKYMGNNSPSLIQQRTNASFNSINTQSDFMYLVIGYEQIFVQGFVDKIVLSKIGVFDPAPVFTFSFVILFDINRTQDYNISNKIKQYYYSNFGDSMDVQTSANINIQGTL